MYDTLFYKPIYNLMVYLSEFLVDFGWVIVITTLIIKFILYPLYKAQIENQIAMKKAQPEQKKIQEKMRNKNLTPAEKQALAFELMAVNKKYGVKMFLPLIGMIVQMTILITLYLIIYKSGFPKISTEYLYSFVKPTKELNMTFLSYFNLMKPSVILAFLTMLTQYWYFVVSMPEVKISDLKSDSGKMKDDFMSSFQVYMKFGMPIMAFLVTMGLNAGIALYWTVSNLFMIFQEIKVRKSKDELKKLTN